MPIRRLDQIDQDPQIGMSEPEVPKFDDWVKQKKFTPLDDLTSFAVQNNLEVGSTTGGRHNRNSKHYTGNAIDIRNSGRFSDQQVADLSAKAAASGIKIRDERTRPKGQAVWGGPHIHAETGQKPIPKFDEWEPSPPSGQVNPPKQRVQKPTALPQPAPIQSPISPRSIPEGLVLPRGQRNQGVAFKPQLKDDEQWGEPTMTPQGRGAGELRRIEGLEKRIEADTGQARLRQLDDPETARVLQQQRVIEHQVASEDPLQAKANPEALRRRVAQRLSETYAEEARAKRNEPEVNRLTALYRQDIQKQGGSAWLNEALSRGGAGVGQFAAGLGEIAARFQRDPEKAKERVNQFLIHAQAMERAAVAEGVDRNVASQFVQNAVAQTIATAPEFAAMIAGVKAPVAFGAGSAIRAVGREEPLRQVGKETVHGVAGALPFELGVPKAIKNPFLRALTRAGTVGGATTGIEYAGGAPLGQAAEAGFSNALMTLPEAGRRPPTTERSLTEVPDINATLARRAEQRPTLRPEDVARLGQPGEPPPPPPPGEPPARPVVSERPKPIITPEPQAEVARTPEERGAAYVADARRKMAEMEAEEAARQQPASQVAAQSVPTAAREPSPTESAVKPVAPESVLRNAENVSGSGTHELAQAILKTPEWKARVLSELDDGAEPLPFSGSTLKFRTKSGEQVTIQNAADSTKPPTVGSKRSGLVIERGSSVAPEAATPTSAGETEVRPTGARIKEQESAIEEQEARIGEKMQALRDAAKPVALTEVETPTPKTPAVAEQRETVSSAETPKWDEKESGISYERALELEGVSDYPRRSAGLAHFDELTPQEKLSVIAAQERELAAAKLETREEYKQARGYGAVSRRLGTKNIGGMDRYKAAQAREKLLEQQVAKLKTRTKIEPAEQREVAPTTEVAPETKPEATVKTPDQIYDESLAAFREASKKFTAITKRYRAKEINDAEFVSARREFNAAKAAADVAEQVYIDAKNGVKKPTRARAVSKPSRVAEKPVAVGAPPKPEAFEPSASPLEIKPKPQSQTGFNKTQSSYIVRALEQGAKRLPLTGEAGSPLHIKVPDDGEFTLKNQAAASKLHKKLTGQPIEGIAPAKRKGAEFDKAKLDKLVGGNEKVIETVIEQEQAKSPIDLEKIDYLQKKLDDIRAHQGRYFVSMKSEGGWKVTDRQTREVKGEFQTNAAAEASARELNALPATAPPKGEKPIVQRSRKIVAEREAGKKKQTIKERILSEEGSFDPEYFVAKIIVEGADFYNVNKPKFDAWAKEMRDRFGEVVEPHLRRVYAGITGTREADIPAEKPAETIPEREPTFREETSIRNAATKELREDIGLADLPPAERKSREESIENAQRKGLVDKTDEIADRIIKAGREEGLSLDEEAAFLVKTRELENQWEAAYRADPKDPAIKDIKAELDKLTKASNMGGTEIGRALAFRQAMVNRDFKLINLVRNVEKARERPVTEKELATFDKIIKERDAAIAERDALMAQQQPPSVEKFVAEEKIKIRQRGVTRSRADLQSERVALKAELGELFKVPSAKEFFKSEKGEFDPKKTAQLTRILRDLARNYIEDGVLKAKDVADAVYKEIKDVSTITRDEVDDLVGRYGQVKQPTRDPVQQKLNEITAILAATSGKRDVLEKAIRAARSGQRRAKPSEDLRRANRELDDAMRQMGPELGRTPYDVTRQKATPLDKAKTTARNRIEQLQKWIADGKREVGQRTTIIADAELMRLKAERDGLERAARLLDDPAADAKAVERRLGELSKLIRETEAKVRVGQVKPEQKEGARSLWSPEIGAMEQEHATLRKVLSDMRAEAGRAERAAAKAGESETPFYGAEQSWSAFEAEANRSLRRVKQLEAKAAEYERRIREQDFSEKVTTRKPTTYNDAVRRAQLKVAKAENQYRQEEARAMGGHWARNISGMMKAGLLGPKTMVKNFFGTFGWGMFEEQGRIFAGLMDNAISMGRQAAGKGAQRGIMGLSPTAVIESMGYGSTVGGRQAIDILKRGASEELMERHQYGEIYFGRTGKPKLDTTLKALELSFNGTYRIMSASDRLFYQTQHRRNLIDRATVMAHNEGLRGAERRTRAEELIKQADEIKAKTDRGEKIPEKIARLDADAKFDALVSTFNNDNQLSTRVKNFRRKVKDPRSDRSARQLDRSNALMNLGLDFLVPFDRTPTNVISRIVEASPLGLGKMALQVGRALKERGMDAEAQRQFSRTFGRASAGTLNMALGAWLYGKVITIDEKDQAWLDLGFTKINLNTISPLGNLIGFGARMAKAYGKENASWGDYAKPALKEVTNFPILRASQPVAEAVQDPERSIPKTAARYAGMAVPYSGTLRTIAEATDTETDRKPKGFSETLKMGIPGLRQQVPVDVKGRAKQQKASLIEQKRNKQITESDLKALVRDEVITEQDMIDIMREGKLTPMQSRIANVQHPETALDQYEKMSDDQRREVKEIMRKRGEGLINSKRLTPDQRKEFRQRLKDVGIRY